MIKFLTAIVFTLAIALPAGAKEITTTKIKLPTLQCGMCKKTIEKKMTGLDGLDSITVDVENKEATIVFDSDVTTLAAIETAISEIGYDANEVAADKKAQRKLNPCCRPGAHD